MDAPSLKVTLGALTLNEWCERCQTSDLATAGVYTLDPDTLEPHRVGVWRYCIRCDDQD